MEQESTKTLLTIDDEQEIRMSLVLYFSDIGFDVLEAENGRIGIERIQEDKPDIVLCDLRMPEVDGLDVLAYIKNESPDTPIIVVSGTGVIEDTIEAVRLGAWDYVLKPIYDMAVLEHSVNKALERAALLEANRRYQEHLEQMVGKRTDELRNAFEGIIQAMSSALEFRDPYTSGHQKRVAILAREIAKRMNGDSDLVQGTYIAGVIHDIGKIAIPAEILTKPTRLLEIEFSLIKNHPQTGYDILKNINFPWPIAKILHQHHERIDGSGYPLGISGNDILLESRIISVSDVVEAMASHRPYRAALGIEQALEEIKKNSGKLYDPEVVEVCLSLFKKYGTDIFNIK